MQLSFFTLVTSRSLCIQETWVTAVKSVKRMLPCYVSFETKCLKENKLTVYRRTGRIKKYVKLSQSRQS